MLLDLLKRRCSVRNFLDKEISPEIIEYMLEAARLSPSGGNEQPWQFGIITNDDLIQKISDLAYKQKWISKSKLIVVLCTRVVSDERGGREIQQARFPEFAREEFLRQKNRTPISQEFCFLIKIYLILNDIPVVTSHPAFALSTAQYLQ
ncbi:MAG: nitroreductase family protein [Halanaerobiales bacterium]